MPNARARLPMAAAAIARMRETKDKVWAILGKPRPRRLAIEEFTPDMMRSAPPGEASHPGDSSVYIVQIQWSHQNFGRSCHAEASFVYERFVMLVHSWATFFRF